MAREKETQVYRYRDATDIKQSTVDNLIPIYFPEIPVNLRTIGLTGLTSEEIANISEDSFNTGSIVYREAFVNRAQIPESIYSHAAIFQVTDVFSKASVCDFLLVMDEDGIIKNAYADTENYDKSRGIHRFFIDKDTIIYVEGIPYTLDYDIEIDIVVRKSDTADDEYVFTARYMRDNMINSISDIENTYVKIIRSGDGYFALQVRAHQVIREVVEETVNSSNLINYPIVEVKFEGKLAGFDVLYRPPLATRDTDTGGWTQLDCRVRFSSPSKKPFCYFQMIDTNILQLTFNSRDNYWSPVFNADLQIILYLTQGNDKGTTFDSYIGNNIELVPNLERWSYDTAFLTAAKPLGSSKGGNDQLSLDALRSFAEEGYRTANALTTEHDLSEYYKNYKYRYGNGDVLFLKKRDDVYERVYSAYIVMRNESYIYHTSTLRLALNISDLKQVEPDIWMLDPGYLFTANEPDGYANFYRDPIATAQYYDMYEQAVINGEIPYIDDGTDPSEIPDYLNRAASFAEYKRRLGVDDKRTVFDLTDEEMMELDSPIDKKFLLVNPFLIRFKKNTNLVSTYLTCLTNESALEFFKQNVGNSIGDDGSFVQFIGSSIKMVREFEAQRRYHLEMNLIPSISVDEEYPIIQGIYNERGILVGYEVGDPYKVADNDLRVFVEILDTDGQPVCVTELYPTSYIFESTTITFSGDIYTDDHITSDNKLRILDGRIYRNIYTEEYYKVHTDDATLYDLYTKDGVLEESSISATYVIVMYHAGEIAWRRSSGHFYDFNEDEGVHYLYYKDGTHVYMYTDTDTSHYYEKYLDDETRLKEYTPSGELVRDNVPWSEIQQMIDDGHCVASYQHDTTAFVEALIEIGEFETLELRIFDNVTNMTTRDDILIPINDVVLKVYTVYRRIYDPDLGHLRPVLPEETNNALLPYDDHFVAPLDCYIWTNEYVTNRDPVTFIRALDNVRVYLMFEDYTEVAEDVDPSGIPIGWHYVHDIMDVQMYSLPYIRWNIVKDPDLLSYFMSTFYAQYMFLSQTVQTTRLRNVTAIDVKFYRTYGCSNDLIIGEDDEPLDVLNLQMEFDMWFVSGTDTLEVVPEVKRFIKTEVEMLDDAGITNLYISNLMRKIELEFDYVDHIRFVRINRYPSTYQAVKCKVDTLNDLSVEERRWYVPEMLLIDTDDIIINEYMTQ